MSALFPKPRGRKHSLDPSQQQIILIYWIAYLNKKMTLAEFQRILQDRGFKWATDQKQLWRVIKRASINKIEERDLALKKITPSKEQLQLASFRKAREAAAFQPPQGRGLTAFLSNRPSQTRWEAIRDYLLDPTQSKTEVCDRFDFSRGNYNMHFKRHLRFGILGLFDRLPGPRQNYICTPQKECEVIELWEKHRTRGSVAKHADLSPNTVKKIFSKYGLGRSAKSLDQIRAELQDQLYVEITSGISRDPYFENYIDKEFVRFLNGLEATPITICNPGALLMAPIVTRLGLAKQVQRLGLTKQDGFSLFQILLVDLNRKLLGLKSISHLDSVTDMSLALASGVARLPCSSTEHQNLFRFTEDHVRRLRISVGRHAIENGIAIGSQIALDFHMIEYYGADEVILKRGKGPHGTKSEMVNGDRALLGYDVETSCPLVFKRYDGKVRGEKVLENFLEQVVEYAVGMDRLTLVLADAEFPSLEILDFFYRKQLDTVMAYTRYSPIKRKAKLFADKFMPGEQTEDSFLVTALEIDKKKTRYALILVKKADDRVFAFVTTRDLLVLSSTERVRAAEELVCCYRNRARIEVGFKEQMLCYSLETQTSHDATVTDLHLLTTVLADQAVRYLSQAAPDVFSHMSMETLRRYCLTGKNANVTVRDRCLVVRLLDPPRGQKQRRMFEAFKQLLDENGEGVVHLNGYSVRLVVPDNG